MSDNTSIAKIEAQEAVHFIPFSTEAVDAVLASIKAQCVVKKPDISTAKGREEIASAAHKVSKRKVEFVKEIAAAIEDTKNEVKRVDSERLRFEKAADALRLEVRQPLTEWENVEKARVAERERRLAELDALRHSSAETQEQIKARIAKLAELSAFEWQEFTARATEKGEEVLAALQSKLAEREKFDAEMAELARLRQEAAEREQREREERIKAEAAENAKREAEAVAKRERDAVEVENRRKQEEAEKAARAAELKAKAEAEEAERKQIALQREKDAAEARAKKAEEDAARAVEEERKRVEKEKSDAEAAERKRAADRAHKAKINNEAVEDLRKGAPQLSEELAIEVVKLIALGKIRNITIRY